MQRGEEISGDELKRRVLYSLLLPAVRLARLFGASLRDLEHLLHVAYFQELRASGRSLRSTSEQMDISMRTAARLSKQLKGNFFEPERAHELPRRIEFALWYEPLSLARIKRELSDVEEADIEAAIAQLIAEERVVRQPGRTETFAVTRGERRIVRDRWTARIGALNSLMGNVSGAVWGRFFQSSPSAFARTLSFRIRAEDLPVLANLYEHGLFRPLQKLEEQARDDLGALEMSLSILWAEYTHLPDPKAEPDPGDEKP